MSRDTLGWIVFFVGVVIWITYRTWWGGVLVVAGIVIGWDQ